MEDIVNAKRIALMPRGQRLTYDVQSLLWVMLLGPQYPVSNSRHSKAGSTLSPADGNPEIT